MVYIDNGGNVSKSPTKPRLLIEFLKRNKLEDYFPIDCDWQPFENEEFLIAHTPEYVNAFFEGVHERIKSNDLEWSPEFANTVRYTNASLYNAIRHAIINPGKVCFSPTSGFHHAKPNQGDGFCTFSGQVIASVKIYEEFRRVGAYIDLDGHFGNSLEDAREFNPIVNLAVPKEFNFNPEGEHETYLLNLEAQLLNLNFALATEKVHYVVFAHGADSHEWDDCGILGYQGTICTTKEWLKAADMVYSMIRNISYNLGKPIPLILSLFGGYRSDDFDSVLSLHTADLVTCLNILCGNDIAYTPTLKKPLRFS